MKCPMIGKSPGKSDFNEYEVSGLFTEVIRQFRRGVVFIVVNSSKNNERTVLGTFDGKLLGLFSIAFSQSRKPKNERFL